MTTVFTADGLEELEESMAQCDSFKSMKCSCTDYLCCLPAPTMPEPKVDTTNHAINFIPFSFNLQIILYNLKNMYYFSFQAKFEDQLYSLQPSLFFNDVVTLKDRVDLSRKIIRHTLYYIRRVPFWMLAVYCVDGLNVYYQMLQHVAQCV